MLGGGPTPKRIRHHDQLCTGRHEQQLYRRRSPVSPPPCATDGMTIRRRWWRAAHPTPLSHSPGSRLAAPRWAGGAARGPRQNSEGKQGRGPPTAGEGGWTARFHVFVFYDHPAHRDFREARNAQFPRYRLLREHTVEDGMMFRKWRLIDGQCTMFVYRLLAMYRCQNSNTRYTWIQLNAALTVM